MDGELNAAVVAGLAVLSMIGAALLGLFIKRLTAEHLQEHISSAVGLVAGLFVVMTSLTLGLMLNSAKSTQDTNRGNARTLATDIILLDRTVRGLGPEADEARRNLRGYVQEVLTETNVLEEVPQAEAWLNAVGDSLKAIRVSDEQQVALWNDALALYRQVVRHRWVVVDAAGGTIPRPLIITLILWLAIIFASFGYRVPHSTIIMASFALAALLISFALYLILDMDSATSTGVFYVGTAPFQRALEVMQR